VFFSNSVLLNLFNYLNLNLVIYKIIIIKNDVIILTMLSHFDSYKKGAKCRQYYIQTKHFFPVKIHSSDNFAYHFSKELKVVYYTIVLCFLICYTVFLFLFTDFINCFYITFTFFFFCLTIKVSIHYYS
jgi:hypothetical protein